MMILYNIAFTVQEYNRYFDCLFAHTVSIRVSCPLLIIQFAHTSDSEAKLRIWRTGDREKYVHFDEVHLHGDI